MKNVNKIFMCGCHGEGLVVDKFYDNEIYLAMFSQMHRYNGQSKMGLKEKLRWIWHILTTGEPWIDEMILTDQCARELGKELLRISSLAGEDIKATG